MTLSDDTQPKSPLKQAPPAPSVPPQQPEDSGAGCMVWGIVGGITILIALAVVGLAGAAGWTSGLRDVQTNQTATQNAVIGVQVTRFSADVAQGNGALAAVRLEYLATQTPGIPQVPALVQTATALHLTNQPTATQTPSPTLTPTATLETVTTEEAEIVPTVASGGGQYDPAALLTQARNDIQAGEYDSAIDTLEAILVIDPNFERTTVVGLLTDALQTRALQLYRNGTDAQLARAIRLTDRAETFGTLRDGLSVEREAATLYLNAKSTVGTSDFANGIRYLEQLSAINPNYRGGEIQRMLISMYTAYGDGLVAQGNPCSAVTQYDNALRNGFNANTSAKRDAAQITCEQGTPTPEGFVPPPGDPNSTPAPIGQPGS